MTNFIKRIVVPALLMKESFFEIDGERRRNIYIYLWYTSFAIPVIVLDYLLINSFNIATFSIGTWCLYSYLYLIEIIALSALTLRREKIGQSNASYIFQLRLQVFFVVHVYIGINICFEIVISQLWSNLSMIFFALTPIVTLWVLKDMLYLRQHAFKKVF